MYTHVHIHVHTYIYMYTHARTHMHAWTHTPQRQAYTHTHTYTHTKTDLFFIPSLVSNILLVFEIILIVISPVTTPLLCRKEFTRSSRNVPNRVVGNPTEEKLL